MDPDTKLRELLLQKTTEIQKLKSDLEKVNVVLNSKMEWIRSLESELKRKQKEVDTQKQKVMELTEIMNRQVRDKGRPNEHRQGTFIYIYVCVNIEVTSSNL